MLLPLGPRVPEGLRRPGRWASWPHPPQKQLPISPSAFPPRRKLKLDLLYIKRQTFWLDLKPIALSFWITLRTKWMHRGQKIWRGMASGVQRSQEMIEEQMGTYPFFDEHHQVRCRRDHDPERRMPQLPLLEDRIMVIGTGFASQFTQNRTAVFQKKARVRSAFI